MKKFSVILFIILVSGLAHATPGDLGCSAKVGSDIISVTVDVNGSAEESSYGLLRVSKNGVQQAAFANFSVGPKKMRIGRSEVELLTFEGKAVTLAFLDESEPVNISGFAIISVNLPGSNLKFSNVVASCE